VRLAVARQNAVRMLLMQMKRVCELGGLGAERAGPKFAAAGAAAMSA